MSLFLIPHHVLSYHGVIAHAIVLRKLETVLLYEEL